MTATIVPFSKKTPTAIKRKTKSADDLDLDPPTTDDLKGFINTINFLALQSGTNSIDIGVMGDEMNIKIQHYDHDDFIETKEVVSTTCFEISAGIEYNPDNQKKMIDDLLLAFARLEFENYEEEVVVAIVDSIEDENEADGNPTE